MDTTADLEKFKLAVDNAYDHIIITDPDAKIIYANPAATKITGYSQEEMIGQTPRLWGGNMPKDFYKNMWKIIKFDKKTFHAEIKNKRKSGQEYVAEVSISPVLDGNGEVIYFVGIERDITIATEVDKMKTEFVSLASHQLRTPLTGIKWFMEMLLGGEAGELNEEQKKYAQNIFDSNERMIELVNSLLNISRIESGRIMVSPVPTNLATLVNEVISHLKQKMVERNLSLLLKIEDNLPVINVDAKLISNVYLNLLNNSIAYTPSEGRITVSLYKKEGNLISEISDTGLGIPKAEQDKIFQKFFRASNAVKLSPGGSGLGLYLAKAIVESSGGKMWFVSVENKGSTFSFSLPLAGSKPKEGEVSIES